ncbi:Pycsar system effector family protein [Actinomadura fibrosa]|uniref:Pycsar system effector family protein n=1 Tax=Actinomadura fibrosa TaxID=111802 RepID=A0ABW2XNV6_9ACTN|nr:Pycsar system effector family protein [Actinomadura fibrosa]
MAQQEEGPQNEGIAKAIADANDQSKTADQKAAILLAAVGIVIAILVSLLSGNSMNTLPKNYPWLTGTALATAMCSAIMLLLSVRPRFSRHSDNRSNFNYYAQFEGRARELERELSQGQAGIDNVARLIESSRLARVKHAQTRLAVDFLLATVVVVSVELIVAIFD